MANKLLEDTKEQRISHCRYYKGEAECPYPYESDMANFWKYEEYYADGYTNEDAYQYYKDLGGKDYVGIPKKILGLFVGFWWKWSGYDDISSERTMKKLHERIEQYLSAANGKYPEDVIPGTN